MIISFASGKGGTGKTTLSTNFAVFMEEHLKNNGSELYFLDCDVEEPNAALFLKPIIDDTERVNIMVPTVDFTKCNFCGKCAEVCAYNAIAVVKNNVLIFAELCHGCGGCTLLCPEKAISEIPREIGLIEKGRAGRINFLHGRLNVGEPMATPLIKALKKQIQDARSKITVIDVPPGTSCPVIESVKNSDFTVLVTEPTPFGLNDLHLAAETLKKLKIPAGVIINRSGKGDQLIEKYCREKELPLLLKIPMDIEIAKAYSRGETIFSRDRRYQTGFNTLFKKILELVDKRDIL